MQLLRVIGVAFALTARHEARRTRRTPMENILAKVEGGVGVITLNRPKALNALNNALLNELVTQLEAWDVDDAVRCIVLTGSDRAFAAGADIKEMAPQSYMEMFKANFFA